MWSMSAIRLMIQLYRCRDHQVFSSPQDILKGLTFTLFRPTLAFVLVPANRAAITSLGIYLMIQSRNQFIWPMLVGSKPETYTLTVGVQRFANGEGGSN